MTILNFVTQEELDNLDEDPRIAFMELVNHAQRSLSQQLAKLDPDNEHGWNEREELKQKFMNVLVASGKRFEVEPFASIEVPRHADYRSSDYRQFESDLDHYITQLVLDNSMRSKKSSVEILPDSKEKIRTYIQGLRTCIINANMQGNKKKSLLEKLGVFELELDKKRTNFLAVTLVAFEILAIPGATWASVEITHKLMTNITQVFAESKLLEEQTRQIGPTATPKALSSPRPSKETSKLPGTANLDDDIPF